MCPCLPAAPAGRAESSPSRVLAAKIIERVRIWYLTDHNKPHLVRAMRVMLNRARTLLDESGAPLLGDELRNKLTDMSAMLDASTSAGPRYRWFRAALKRLKDSLSVAINVGQVPSRPRMRAARERSTHGQAGRATAGRSDGDSSEPSPDDSSIVRAFRCVQAAHLSFPLDPEQARRLLDRALHELNGNDL